MEVDILPCSEHTLASHNIDEPWNIDFGTRNSIFISKGVLLYTRVGNTTIYHAINSASESPETIFRYMYTHTAMDCTTSTHTTMNCTTRILIPYISPTTTHLGGVEGRVRTRIESRHHLCRGSASVVRNRPFWGRKKKNNEKRVRYCVGGRHAKKFGIDLRCQTVFWSTGRNQLQQRFRTWEVRGTTSCPPVSNTISSILVLQ